jgi:glyoxylase I family protein
MFNFHHVSLNVKDINKSILFYEKFGFKNGLLWEATDKSLQIAHLKLNDIFIELFCYSNPDIICEKAQESNSTTGIKHFALRVEDIQKTKKELIQNNIASDNIQIIQGRTGIQYFFIQDPDDILIEIVQDNRKFNC